MSNYCISASLAGIANDCQPSLGGIKKVFITNYADDIATYVDDLETGDTVGVVTALSSAITWYEYNFRQESSNFTSTLNKSADGGNYVSTEISLVFHRMETAKRLEVNALALNDMAVIVLDNNNKYWYFGINRPVTASAGTGESGSAFGDRNAYGITLLSNDGRFAPELTDAAITTLKAHIYTGN